MDLITGAFETSYRPGAMIAVDQLPARFGRRLRRYTAQARAGLAAGIRVARAPASLLTSDRDVRLAVSRYLEASKPAALNLGSGTVPMAGWFNIDLDGHGQISRDLTQGLPYLPDDSFDFAFSEHFLEHIERRQAAHLLTEVRRVLRGGGRLRLAIPDLDLVIDRYRDGRWNSRDDEGLQRGFAPHYGGALLTRGEWIDMAFRQWGHRYLYNFEDLSRVLSQAGFRSIERVAHKQSREPFLAGLETRPPDASALVVEAS
jgi:predicted SAM-dependent methyltransferase